jgi:hypothetical protein
MRNFMPVVQRYGLRRIVTLVAATGAILSLHSPVCKSSAAPLEIKQQLSGAPGEEVPLRLDLPAQQAQGEATGTGFVRILGLPPTFSLNRGFAARGAWAVSLSEASALTLSAPANFEGTLLLTVELVQDDSAEPQRWQVQITLVQKPGASPIPPAMAALAPVSPAGTAAVSPAAPQQPKAAESIGSMKAAQPLRAAARAQMDRGKQLLQENDVAAARLVFKRLAESGVAEAAFAMAQTYDPEFLKTIPTAGLQPDMAQARKWYERAAVMGDAAAATRFGELYPR